MFNWTLFFFFFFFKFYMELIFKLKGLNMICNVKYLHKKKHFCWNRSSILIISWVFFSKIVLFKYQKILRKKGFGLKMCLTIVILSTAISGSYRKLLHKWSFWSIEYIKYFYYLLYKRRSTFGKSIRITKIHFIGHFDFPLLISCP